MSTNINHGWHLDVVLYVTETTTDTHKNMTEFWKKFESMPGKVFSYVQTRGQDMQRWLLRTK